MDMVMVTSIIMAMINILQEVCADGMKRTCNEGAEPKCRQSPFFPQGKSIVVVVPLRGERAATMMQTNPKMCTPHETVQRKRVVVSPEMRNTRANEYYCPS